MERVEVLEMTLEIVACFWGGQKGGKGWGEGWGKWGRGSRGVMVLYQQQSETISS